MMDIFNTMFASVAFILIKYIFLKWERIKRDSRLVKTSPHLRSRKLRASARKSQWSPLLTRLLRKSDKK
jgi:hypothetical protein